MSIPMGPKYISTIFLGLFYRRNGCDIFGCYTSVLHSLIFGCRIAGNIIWLIQVREVKRKVVLIAYNTPFRS